MLGRPLRALLAAGVVVAAIASPIDTSIAANGGNGNSEAARAATRAQPNHGGDPNSGWDAYLAAARTYPANVIPPAVLANSKATFDKIAKSETTTQTHGTRTHRSARDWSRASSPSLAPVTQPPAV